MKEKKQNDITLVSHVYDLNVFELMDKMKNFYQEHSKPDELRSRLDFLDGTLESILRRYEGMKPTDTFNLARRQMILPSSDNLYHIFLAYKLLTYDPYRIQAILSYHAVLFQGNIYAAKGNFVGLVEYYIYGHVKSHIDKNEEIRLDKIATWLENNRRFELQKANSSKRVRFDDEFANILCMKLPIYIEDSEDNNLFKSLFEDNYEEKLIVFKLKIIDLVNLFRECKLNYKLSVSSNEMLSIWICERFTVKKSKNKKLNQKTVLNYLNRKLDESIVKSRVSEIFFPLYKK